MKMIEIPYSDMKCMPQEVISYCKITPLLIVNCSQFKDLCRKIFWGVISAALESTKG